MKGERDDLDPVILEEFEEELLQARHDLVLEHGGTEQELDAIEAERESELEEQAQEEHAADVRTRLSAQQYAQLRSIDGALERLERGTFGVCAECQAPISLDRLRVQPWAALCAGDAEKRERDTASGDAGDRLQDHVEDLPDQAADEHLAGAPLPTELEALDDAEVASTIRDAFATEVGDALDDVRVLCRDGVVILAGEVANSTLPQIARRIVEDEVGYEVVDRMLITEMAGGPGRLEPPRRGRQMPEGTLDTSEEEMEADTSEDILEVEEEGLIFVPPSRPVPER